MSSVSDSSRLAGTATVTAAVPLADPEVAGMVAVPSATEVTRPEEDTVATDALDEIQVTKVPDIVVPFWSLTVAESWTVSPSEEKLRVVADSVIDVATGVGGAVVPSPHAASRSTAVSRM